jgi:cyanophycinase
MKCAFSRILLASSLSITASIASASDLMLAGGTLPVCTSLSPNQCRNSVPWHEDALKENTYRVEQDGIDAWMHAAEPMLSPEQFELTSQLLKTLNKEMGSSVSANEFQSAFRRQSISIGDEEVTGEALYQRMSDPAWLKLRDHFQVPARSAEGKPLREEVRLHDSINKHSIEIFERFVDIARARNDGEKPLVLVSTASSRDPYDALAFYLQAFEQAGARVAWLPLDAAVRQAREVDDCDNLSHYQAEILGSYRRARIDPDNHARQQAYCKDARSGLDLIDQASGVFLNGGDQWLTFNAFIEENGDDTPEMRAIRARLANGRLILGGTSAGSAVQSAQAMVTNGSTATGLLRGAIRHSPPPHPGCDLDGTCPDGLRADDLTWHEHGLATVPRGIVDTHFSERQRQFRLARLLADSGVSFGIGIDETTAALVELDSDGDGYSIKTIGKGSSWIVDVSQAHVDQAAVFNIRNVRLLDVPVGQGWKTGDKLTSNSVAGTDSGKRHPCEPFEPGQGFHALVGSLDAGAPARCFELALDDGKTATGRIRKSSLLQPDLKGSRLYLMDLSIKADSVVLPAAPDREQQPHSAQRGPDEADQSE